MCTMIAAMNDDELNDDNSMSDSDSDDDMSFDSPSGLRSDGSPWLVAMWKDIDGDGLAPLRHYLDRFPDHEKAIRDEYPKIEKTSERLEDPTRIDGRYAIVKRLGRGGQATAFLTRDSGRSNCLVVVKVFEPSYIVSDSDWVRIEREATIGIGFQARVAQDRLGHAGLGCVLHLDKDRDGRRYLVMPYYEGAQLDKWLDRLASDGPPDGETMTRVLRVLEQIAHALSAAHRSDVCHRDLKPSNVIVRPTDNPVVIDFGLATRLDRDDAITHTNAMPGTLAYLAPEIVEERGDVDYVAADIYSLGVLAYECLTKVRPFRSKARMQLAAEIVKATPTEIRRLNPAVHPDLAKIVARAMAREPEDRYRSAEDVARVLEWARTALPTEASHGPERRRDVFRPSRRQVIVALSALGVGLATWGWRRKMLDDRRRGSIDPTPTVKVAAPIAGVWLTGCRLGEVSRWHAETGKTKGAIDSLVPPILSARPGDAGDLVTFQSENGDRLSCRASDGQAVEAVARPSRKGLIRLGGPRSWAWSLAAFRGGAGQDGRSAVAVEYLDHPEGCETRAVFMRVDERDGCVTEDGHSKVVRVDGEKQHPGQIDRADFDADKSEVTVVYKSGSLLRLCLA